MITELSGLKRLWINKLGPEENLHSLVLFRRHFVVPEELHDAVIHIAADSDFILTLDGVELDRGQFSDDPLRKTFTAVKVPYLSAGRHLLAIKVYYIGKCFPVTPRECRGCILHWKMKNSVCRAISNVCV